MAATPSNMLPLGTKAPDFKLFDTVSGKDLTFKDIKGPKGTVVMFICNHCPYVLHVNDQIVKIAKDYQDKGIGFVAISSNDVENYPQDAPELMTEQAKKVGYTFPYLYDDTQDAAKAYQAACTPDFYVFDQNDQLVYRGRMDASTPKNNEPNDGKDLCTALDLLLEGKQLPDAAQKPSIGCNIKWKEPNTVDLQKVQIKKPE
ncbi:MAG TPA: thioredoxin family protein [Flavobacteriales bacterium]|jgi:thiol-disulfide isomerase/thioredoxin|nr:thioredoxin family protein [Flavobacteriales bacterium]